MLKNFQIKNINIFYILAIVFLAFILRVMFLGSIPNGFFPDEASNAYDAYSILHTLRDQYGEFLPWYFKSANDYREGLYMYLMIPFIKIFGLNIFGARITSAIIGTLTIIILYYLAKEIFDQRVALLSALFLAISPWHIHFSRITFRAILFPLLFCLALFVFLQIFKNPKFLLLSSGIFAVSIYTFFSARVFIPLFMIGLIFIHISYLKQYKKITILSLLIFLILFIPQLIYQLSPEGMARANEVKLWSNFPNITGNYLSYFSPKFLFFQGDPNPRHTIEKMGELYTFEVVTLLVGLIGLIKHKIPHKKILFLWLLLYPIPAALVSPGSAVRTLIGTPIFAMISAYGVAGLIDFFKEKQKNQLVIKGIIILIIVASLTIFSNRYFFSYPKLKSDAWLPTFKDVILEAKASNYDCIVISDNIESKYAYILVPFYTQMSPSEYHQFRVDVVTDKLDMGRWKIIDFEPYNAGNLTRIEQQLHNNCLYILHYYRDRDALKNQRYSWEDLKIFPTLNNEQYYRLVKLIRN